MRDVHEELRARLRESAETHEPDRARVLARIERGMAAPEERRRNRKATRPPLWDWVRVVSATAGVAGVLAVGGYAVASAVKGEATPADRTVAVSPTSAESPAATSRPAARPEQPSSTPRAKGEPKKPGSTPTSTPSIRNTPTTPDLPASGNKEDGPLWSDGSVDPHSNDFWAQSDLTFKASEQLTELTVQLKIAQTGGVTSAGAWRSLPERDFDLTVEESAGFLVYTWTLKDDRTVPVGTFVFAGQYDHEGGGRDAGDDSYAMTAKSNGENLAVSGDFKGQDDDGSPDEGDS